MQSEGVTWTDIGDVDRAWRRLTRANTPRAEMQEFAQAIRAEGVEAGIKIGMARASNGSGNGHLTLPKPAEMAEYCHDAAQSIEGRQAARVRRRNVS